MWDELNQWWLENRKPKPQPPKQVEMEAPMGFENDARFPGADDVAELENSLTTTQSVDTRQSTKAEESIQELVGAAACLDLSNSASVAQNDYADSDPSCNSSAWNGDPGLQR
jgi:hypothetical protein